MRDPVPANISGEKVETHTFKHSIQWGQVVLGVAAIFVAWKAARLLGSGSSNTKTETSGEYTKR
jgi:hypothetical protein